MNEVLEILGKFFGHIPVSGIEAFCIQGVKAALVLLVTFVLSRIVLKWIDRRIKKNSTSDDATIRIYKRIVRVTLYTAGILIALHVCGMKLTSLFTTSGLFAVALGFALKGIAENYVAGVLNRGDESIKHGDVLMISDQLVRVKSIGIRSTIVRTKDDSDILIPNVLFVRNKFENYTMRDNLCRVSTSVGVSYSSDLKQVRQVLEGACSQVEGRLTQHDPTVLLTDFGDSAVNYQVFIWTEDPWNQRILQAQLNEAIWWALKEAEIEIAFPQLDVHLNQKAEPAQVQENSIHTENGERS
ncbi:MAG: mechanosensitive ion channel domain-containing protein [Gammaproteobacteria bacterium]